MNPTIFTIFLLAGLFAGLNAPSVAWWASVQALFRLDTPATTALFNLDTPATAPFPSDWFTVGDASHNTGRRVNLPSPDCSVRRSDCEDVAVLNTLDGFNLQPRLSVPFDGRIDVGTATSQTIFLMSLGSTLNHDERGESTQDSDESGGSALESDDGGSRIV